MNQTLAPSVLDRMMSLLPVREKPGVMTRAEKLHHWAAAVRRSDLRLIIFHKLEYMTSRELADTGYPHSAFHVAGADPVLQGQGIKQDMSSMGEQTTSAAEIMRFFGLSQAQLHEFSCDCGGSILPGEMANRIDRIATA